MSTITLHFCDICRQDIKSQNSAGETWCGHLKYRIQTPNGLHGEKIELCAQHAEEVYRFVQRLR